MCDKTCNRADSFKSKLNYKVENSHLINFKKKIYLYHDIVTKSVLVACCYWFRSHEQIIFVPVDSGLLIRDYRNVHLYEYIYIYIK